MNKWVAVFLVLASTTALAADPEDRIAAVERAMSPLEIVKGETSPPPLSANRQLHWPRSISSRRVPSVSRRM